MGWELEIRELKINKHCIIHYNRETERERNRLTDRHADRDSETKRHSDVT